MWFQHVFLKTRQGDGDVAMAAMYPEPEPVGDVAGAAVSKPNDLAPNPVADAEVPGRFEAPMSQWTV